jgi:hypothetical protein
VIENFNVTEESLTINHERFKETQNIIDTSIEDTDIVRLNIGGELMATLRSTLTCVANSTLARMFDGSWNQPLHYDRYGNIFLDFDPILFGHLLEQLRIMESNNSQVFHAPPSHSLVIPFKKMLEKLGLNPAQGTDSEIITLNVGGEIIMTYRTTLTQISDSKLAAIVSTNQSTIVDENGRIFLDLNPKLFRHLLSQLHSEPRTTIPCFDPPSIEEAEIFDSMLIELGLKGRYD